MKRFHFTCGNISDELETKAFFRTVLKNIGISDSVSILDRSGNLLILRMMAETEISVRVCGMNNVISEMAEDLLNMRSCYVNLSAPAEWKTRGREKTVQDLKEMENYLCQRAKVIVCAGSAEFCDRVKKYTGDINHSRYNFEKKQIISQR